jgi:predicted Zn-dependent protease with MMP-like domain
MTDEEFERIVTQTIQSLPYEFKTQLDNVEIVIEERPPDPRLLGLYRGVPKTDRGIYYFSLPDKITIYKEPLLRISRSVAEAKQHIRETVLHEIGHHFGLSDAELYRIKSSK